jgi:hypothetical protein
VAGTCTPNICPVPPANDTCGGAITVSVGTPAATGDNTSASTSLDEDTTCIGSLNGVWYDFTAPPAGGSFQIDTEGSAQFDTVLAVFSACGGTELACDDEGGTGSLSLLVINLAPSQNIKILVATWEFEDPGAFNLNISSVTTGACCSTSGVCTTSSPAACLTGYQGDNTVCTPNPCPQPGACCDAGGCCTLVQVASCTGTFNGAASCTPNPCGAAPANDECAGAIALSVNSAVSGSTCLATTSAEAASTCQTLSNADVWYSFAPAASGTFTITACGSAFDTILTLFTGACGAVTEVDCDDDTCDGLTPPGSGLASIIPDVALNSGTTYLIRLSSFGSSRGTFTLSVTGEAAVTGACCCGSTCSLTTAAACTGTNTFFSGTGTVCNAPGNNSTPCCVTDYNQSGGAVGQTTVQDIFDFLAGYFSADACADINGGGVSVQDIFDFLSAYFAAASGGC